MADSAEPQMLSRWIRRSLEEVSVFATEEVLAAFQEIMGDDQLWAQAKGDPNESLRSRQINVPDTLTVVFADEAALVDKPARRCLRVCRSEPLPDAGAPPIVWCYELCLL